MGQADVVIMIEESTSKGQEYKMKWLGYPRTTWESETALRLFICAPAHQQNQESPTGNRQTESPTGNQPITLPKYYTVKKIMIILPEVSLAALTIFRAPVYLLFILYFLSSSSSCGPKESPPSL